MEPRKDTVVGAGGVVPADGSTEAPQPRGAEVPPGSKSVAQAQGSSRNLGGLVVSTENPGEGNRVNKAQAVASSVPLDAEQRRGRTVVTALRRKRSE